METTRDLMTPNPVVVRPDTPLSTCASRMLEHRVRHLPVVDGLGRATFVLTDVAVFRHGGLTGADLELWVPFQGAEGPLTADQVKLPVEVIAHRDAPAATTLRRLAEARQDFALVIDDDHRLVGIITEHDGVAVAAEVLADSPRFVDADASVPVATIRSDARAGDAFALMESHGLRHLGVVDLKGDLVGVISMGDLLSEQVPGQPRLTVKDVMRPRTPITVMDGTRLGEAAGKMLAARIGCLPILNDAGRPRRILTRSDLIEAALIGIEERAAFSGPDEEGDDA